MPLSALDQQHGIFLELHGVAGHHDPSLKSNVSGHRTCPETAEEDA
jgi:hypothetical protein